MIKFLKQLVFGFFLMTNFVFSQTKSLDYYLDEGVKNSPLLKDIYNQIKSLEQDSLILGANQKPQVSAIGQLMLAPTYNGYGYNDAVTNGGTYLGMINVSKLLANRKFVNAQYESINIQRQISSNTAKISEHDLKKSVTDQYLIVYQDKKQIDATKSIIDLLKKETDLLMQLAEAGMYKQSDLLSFKIEMQTQEITYDQLKIQYQSDLFSLNNICGITDTSMVEITTPNLIKHVQYSIENIPPFFKFHLDSLTIINSKTLLDLNYRPQLNAFANAGFNAVPIMPPQQNIGVSFGLNFNLPLYDGNQRKLGYKKFEFMEDTRRNYKEFMGTQYKIQLRQIEENRKANNAIKLQLLKQKSDINNLMEMNKKQLEAGGISITDYILNVRRSLDLQNDLNAAEIKELLLINSTNYITWQ